MAKKPTSNVVEEERQDSAPSETSAKTDQPETETPKEEAPNLAEIMQGMSDYELVQVGLCVMALLHQRATEELDEPDSTDES